MASTRWMRALESALSKGDTASPSYSFATSDVMRTPRARTVVHRGFIHPPNSTDKLLLTTTDIRTQKVQHVLTKTESQAEVCWWIPETKEQFRIEASAFIIPAPDHPLYPKLSEGFKKLAGLEWWEEERKKSFDSLSSFMRASWARPPPGSPIPSYDEGRKWPSTLPKLDQGQDEEENEQIAFAFSNFALLVLQPTRVDYVELATQPNQRTIFTTSNDRSTWQEQIVVP